MNAAPAAITGTATVCTGAVTSLTDATGAGTWSSNDATIATVGTTGAVSGVAAGTTTLSYTLGTGCSAEAIVTVNQSPAAITGTAAVCQGSNTALTNSVGGGTWSSSDGTVATVGTDGTVSGVAGGTATISYTVGSCAATTVVTVNPVSAITGNVPVCLLSLIHI